MVIMKSKSWFLAGVGLSMLLLIALVGCSDSSEDQSATPMASSNQVTEVPKVEEPAAVEEVSKNIVEIAIEDGRFTTLVMALQAAELDGVLTGDGPFTVFAPTDDAFGKLPEGTLDSLLADIPALKDILLYHVVSGKVMATDVVDLESAETLQGSAFSISSMGGKVMVDESEVIITDIVGSNGVIHVVDTVLIPR
jgi:uncharacterized surface protein with fasciclin (FAS1) repeats